MSDVTTTKAKPKAAAAGFASEMPKFEIPRFDLPKFEVPKMEVPAAFREFAENIPTLPRDAPHERDLAFEIRIIRRQPEAIRRRRQIDGIALLDAQRRHRLLRQEKAGRIPNLRDFQSQHGTPHVLTTVRTYAARPGATVNCAL